MSKSELKSLGPTFFITRRIESELKKNLDKLKNILADNPEFANTLVEQSLLLSKGVYTNDIRALIYKEYSSHTKAAHSIRTQLFDVTYELGTLIGGSNELIKNEKIKHPEIGNSLRSEIEAAVQNIFFNEENTNVDIMGDSNSQ